MKDKKKGCEMGFFNKTKCPICEREIGAMEKTTWKKDGNHICASCYGKLYSSGIGIIQVKQTDACDLRKIIQENQKITEAKLSAIKKFNVTKLAGNQILIDEKNKLWTVGKNIYNAYKTYGNNIEKIPGIQNRINIYSFSDIVDFELLEDGYSITKGGVSIGKALLGDFLVGVPGFIVGGVTGKRTTKTTCDNMQIRITLNNFESPMIMVPIITTRIPKGTKAYKNAVAQAQEILSCLNIMSNAKDKPEKNIQNATASSADEIKKYKELLDSGAITEQEYEKKKKQLLSQ